MRGKARAEGGDAEQGPAHRVEPDCGDDTGEEQPGWWQVEELRRLGRNHGDRERLEPPVTGYHHCAEERGHVADQAEPAQSGGLPGVDGRQCSSRAAIPSEAMV